MVFTEDWLSRHIPVWEAVLDKKSKKVLEIGSFEGKSCVWFCENLEGCTVTCVDTFEGSMEHTEETKSGLRERFDENTEEYKDRITVLVGTSDKVLRTLPYEETYDVVYIDGSHLSKDVLTDAILTWPLLKTNGIMIFDDYRWPTYVGTLQHPAPGIHVFLNMFDGEFKVLHNEYQLILAKVPNEEVSPA